MPKKPSLNTKLGERGRDEVTSTVHWLLFISWTVFITYSPVILNITSMPELVLVWILWFSVVMLQIVYLGDKELKNMREKNE